MKITIQLQKEKYYKNRNINKNFLTDLSDEYDKMRQHKFMLEKDLRSLDTEFHSQQKYTIGMLTGIRTDFRYEFNILIKTSFRKLIGLLRVNRLQLI